MKQNMPKNFYNGYTLNLKGKTKRT